MPAAVCDGYIEGATARVCVPGRNDRHPEVPDTPRRQVDGSSAFSPHMVHVTVSRVSLS